MSNSSIAQWSRSIPTITYYLMASRIVVAVLGYTIAFFTNDFYAWWPFVWNGFEFGRLFSFLLNLGALVGEYFNIVFLYQHSKHLETTIFRSKPADYCWFIVMCLIFTVSLNAFKIVGRFNDALLMAVLYLWSRYYPMQMVNFMTGIMIKGSYLAYAWMVFELVVGFGSIPYASIFGAISAHIYYYLKVEAPSAGGVDNFPTPEIINKFYTRIERDGLSRNDQIEEQKEEVEVKEL